MRAVVIRKACFHCTPSYGGSPSPTNHTSRVYFARVVSLGIVQMMGGLIGRYGVEGEDEDFELGKPDETLSR